jgi:hypothetical protein
MYVIHKFLDSVVCKANSYVSCCIYIHGLIKSQAPYSISIPQYILYIVPRRYFIWRQNIKLIITGRIKKEMYLSPIQNTKNNYIDNLLMFFGSSTLCFISRYMSVQTNNLYELFLKVSNVTMHVIFLCCELVNIGVNAF